MKNIWIPGTLGKKTIEIEDSPVLAIYSSVSFFRDLGGNFPS